MKTLILMTFLFSQSLFAVENIDFASQIVNNLDSKQNLEIDYQTELEQLSIEAQEEQLADYIKQELEFEQPEAIAEGDAADNLKQ